MRLFEFEAKELLKKHGVPVPRGTVLEKSAEVGAPCVVKAQVLFGNRAAMGGVLKCWTKEEAKQGVSSLLGRDLRGETVARVLVEELIECDSELYVSFLFDTDVRAPVLLVNAEGGAGVEGRGAQQLVISPLQGLAEEQVKAFLQGISVDMSLAPVLVSLWDVFVSEDCKLLEINPLAKTRSGVVCLDARVELDDLAMPRHKEGGYSLRSPLGRPFTGREKAVKEANDADYRGTVKYLELDGDIAFLAAGGGGSITCMDALIDAGGKPANYTEFSGDPTEEKMYVLTKQALSKPGIKGCWIVGAIANFSRVDTMMNGIARALGELNPRFPIVVRRAGPNEEAGHKMLRDAAEKNGWKVELFGAEASMTETAELVVRRAYGDSA